MNDVATYAVIRTGGNQIKVAAGDSVRMETIEGEPGSEIVFPEVLLLSVGDAVTVGHPVVKGASVKGLIVKHARGKKLRIYRYKRKKGYQRTLGHRQNYTLVKIQEIVHS
jgi:large subunit ribosomal protein L21